MLITAVAIIASCPKAWALSGKGTDADPYLIYTAADMFTFADIVNGTNGKTRNTEACAKLMADIPNLGEWTPIGNNSGHFKGTFDGQQHVIDGMTITNYTKVNQGLFGYIDNATVKSFYLSGTMTSDTKITGGDNDCSGTVVGYAIGKSYIYDIISTVNVTLTKAQKHIGGIVGQINDSTQVVRCEYGGTLDAGPTTDCIGGVVGFMHASSSAEIARCSCNGHLKSSGSGPTMGGILGYVNNDRQSAHQSINVCLSMARFDFVGNDQYVNGVIGRARGTSGNSYINVGRCYYYSKCIQRGINESAIQYSAKELGVYPEDSVSLSEGGWSVRIDSHSDWHYDMSKHEMPTLDRRKPMVYKSELLECNTGNFLGSLASNVNEEYLYMHSNLKKVEHQDPTCAYGWQEHFRCMDCYGMYVDTVQVYVGWPYHLYGGWDSNHRYYEQHVCVTTHKLDAHIDPVAEHVMNSDSSFCTKCNHGFIHAINNQKDPDLYGYPEPGSKWNQRGDKGDPIEFLFGTVHYDKQHPEYSLEFTNRVRKLPMNAFHNERTMGHIILPSTIEYVERDNFFDRPIGFISEVRFQSIPEFDWDALTGNASGNWYYSDHDQAGATLHLNDESYVFTGTNDYMLEFDTITYTRQHRFEWGTLCVPFEIDLDDQECPFFDLVEVKGDTLIVEEIHGIRPAGTPLIFHIDPELVANGPHKMTFHSCAKKPDATGTLTLPEVDGLIPTGHYDRRVMRPEDGYMLSQDSFRNELGLENGEAVSQGPFRCTLERADKSHSAEAPTYCIRVRQSNTTGIQKIANAQNQDCQYYSINGNRLAQPQKGMNIVRQADGSWHKVLKK